MKTVDYRRKLMIRSGMGMSGRLKLKVVNADGSIAEDRPWQNNLILDSGLDWICQNTGGIGGAFTNCAVGTGTTPTYTDSGAITVTVASGTATASASFFNSGMVGMLLRADTGEEQYITAYTSGTVVSVSGSESVVAQLFTVWAVNQTALGAEVKRTNTYLTGAGNCGTTSTAGTATRVLKRTYDFSTEVSSQNYSELGWSPSASAGANLFSRVLISGGTVTVLPSQQLRVVYELTVVISPSVSTAQTLSISGWPVSPATSTDGHYIANCQSFSSDSICITVVDTNGSGGGGGMEPGFLPMRLSLNSDATLPSFDSGMSTGTLTASSTNDLQTYVIGNFYRDIIYRWIASNGNRTDIGSLYFDLSGTPGSNYASFVFDQDQTKDNTHLLEITWRRFVGRTLTNP